MPTFKSDFMNAVHERGYVHQCTDDAGLDAFAGEKRVVAYIGFDCTAPSLHVGSLVQIMMLRLLQKTGHRPIVLLGGGTTKVGDPSGKDESRGILTYEQIEENKRGIRRAFEKYLSFDDGPTGAIMADNAEWLDELNYISLLRDYGPHFTINRMLTFDSVKLRLEREQPLTFLEFNYMILQAYDFVELARRHDCVMQMGGSDQWGNIVNGIELGRRVDGLSLYGLTSPLITTSSGAKMGKSADGAVWLDAEMVGAYEFWQYWRNAEDADVGRFLGLFTELPMDEVNRLAALEGAELNDAKKILATEVTALCHGAEAAREAEETSRRTFEEGAADEGLPGIEISEADFGGGLQAFELFRRAGLANSNGEARRLIKGGGARINGRPVASETETVEASAFSGRTLKLSAGKKRHALVKLVAG